MSEIGSEFDFRNEYLRDQNNGRFDDGLLTYSGRTAIHAAVSDILKYRAIDKAWLPSYCCDSMVQPFRDLGISVDFYSVRYDFEKNGIVYTDFDAGKNDVVLSMGYFGFDSIQNAEIIKKCLDNRIKVIEDCTHSLLSDNEFLADYRVSSLRKWFPTASGGFVQKREGELALSLGKCDPALVDLRISAMKEKTEYLAGKTDEASKNVFLDKYRTVNRSFSENYKDIAIDQWSETVVKYTDIKAVAMRRRENAEILLKGLSEIFEITPIFSSLGGKECPLFVPILINDRAKLQKYLAGNRIYCPAHWPRHNEKANSNLYDRELSLICDQRYCREDMERMLAVIKDYFKEI